MAILAVAAIAGLFILEGTKVYRTVPGHDQKVAAVQLAQQAYDVLRSYYVDDLGRTIDLGDDPANTGLIGPRSSPIKNAAGNNAGKRTSVNPNFAALIVDYFQQAGLEPGDLVAVGLTGSFAGTNVNLYAAIATMGLEPIVITAVGASSWGATDPEFTWLDMERVLAEQDIIHIRSAAASAGGSDDMGGSKSAEDRQVIFQAIARNEIPLIESRSIDESITKRMDAYFAKARGGEIDAFVSVGGGIANLGFNLSDIPIPSGLHYDIASWPVNWPREGPLVQFANRGVPIIQLGLLQGLARRYELSVAPKSMPPIGEGTLLGKQGYSMPLVALITVLYLLLALFLMLPSWRRLIVRQGTRGSAAMPPVAGN